MFTREARQRPTARKIVTHADVRITVVDKLTASSFRPPRVEGRDTDERQTRGGVAHDSTVPAARLLASAALTLVCGATPSRGCP
mmetsp:Transcript_9125/g.23914  ORF Transcript_9125/g.23914 Transcript_9125/m.23914 type:complete len:84 (+) Transcript_9125:127-378(+)